MRFVRIGAVVMLAGLGVAEALSQQRTGVVLPVLVYNYANVPAATLHQAQEVTSRIFETSGVVFEWHACRVDVSQPQTDAYCSQFHRSDIALKILARSNTHKGSDEDIGGFVPSGEMVSDAYVFYDRLRDMAVQESVDLAILLGSIIAHEFGHLLLGTDGHSVRGLMQARWSARSLARAAASEARFSTEQNERIYDGALSRIRAAEGL